MIDSIATAIADDLTARGWSIAREFVGTKTVQALRDEAQLIWRTGQFKSAGIGRAARHYTDPAIRSDSTAWIEPECAGEGAREFLIRMDVLRAALNARCYLGLFDLEAHFARYDIGARYARHLDRFRDDSARVLSCVLYLNDDWQAADGGALRIELEAGATLDVVPDGGTMVIFLSERFPHEVLPAQRERWSIAAWFRTRLVQ